MYARRPDIAAGFTLEDYEEDEIEVWPENWPVFTLFSRLQTQWFVGMSGPTGLRYEAVYPLLDRMTDDKEEWEELLADLQIMEIEVLKQITEPRK